MKVLVACEFSGIVRDAFAARGHDAGSFQNVPRDRGRDGGAVGRMLPLSKQAALEAMMTFTADFPGAVVFPCHDSNQLGPPNNPKGWVAHTPEEPADGYPATPHWFAQEHPDRAGSTHYFVSYMGEVFQCVSESSAPIANGVLGKPYPAWADPGISLNRQTLSVEIEGYAESIADTLVVGSAQWNALVKLIRDRGQHYDIPLDRSHIIGHYEVSTDRSDPGAGFPWDALIRDVNGGDEMYKIADWWTNRKIPTKKPSDKYEINLFADFGPAKAYDLRLVMAPGSRGMIVFQHGDFATAGMLAGNTRAASFMVIPGAYGTAPFDVVSDVEIAFLACAGVIPYGA